MSDDKDFYCPFCARNLRPETEEDGSVVICDGGYIYVHDNVPHDDDFDLGQLQ